LPELPSLFTFISSVIPVFVSYYIHTKFRLNVKHSLKKAEPSLQSFIFYKELELFFTDPLDIYNIYIIFCNRMCGRCINCAIYKI